MVGFFNKTQLIFLYTVLGIALCQNGLGADFVRIAKNGVVFVKEDRVRLFKGELYALIDADHIMFGNEKIKIARDMLDGRVAESNVVDLRDPENIWIEDLHQGGRFRISVNIDGKGDLRVIALDGAEKGIDWMKREEIKFSNRPKFFRVVAPGYPSAVYYPVVESRKPDGEIDALRTENSQLRETKEQLERESRSLKDQSKTLRDENETLKDENEALRKEVRISKDRGDTLPTPEPDYGAIVISFAAGSMLTVGSIVVAKRMRSRQRLASSPSADASLRHQVQVLKEEAEKHKRETEKQRSRAQELEHEKQSLRDDLDNIKRQTPPQLLLDQKLKDYCKGSLLFIEKLDEVLNAAEKSYGASVRLYSDEPPSRSPIRVIDSILHKFYHSCRDRFPQISRWKVVLNEITETGFIRDGDLINAIGSKQSSDDQLRTIKNLLLDEMLADYCSSGIILCNEMTKLAAFLGGRQDDFTTRIAQEFQRHKDDIIQVAKNTMGLNPVDIVPFSAFQRNVLADAKVVPPSVSPSHIYRSVEVEENTVLEVLSIGFKDFPDESRRRTQIILSTGKTRRNS